MIPTDVNLKSPPPPRSYGEALSPPRRGPVILLLKRVRASQKPAERVFPHAQRTRILVTCGQRCAVREIAGRQRREHRVSEAEGLGIERQADNRRGGRNLH